MDSDTILSQRKPRHGHLCQCRCCNSLACTSPTDGRGGRGQQHPHEHEILLNHHNLVARKHRINLKKVKKR